MIRIILLLFILSLPSVAYPQPSISFNELKYDFGVISQDEKAGHIFEFTNNGDKDLIVEKVTAS